MACTSRPLPTLVRNHVHACVRKGIGTINSGVSTQYSAGGSLNGNGGSITSQASSGFDQA
eukprot:3681193-Pleurochrysis_carterae.AAC.1